jgi:hypothetical protein
MNYFLPLSWLHTSLPVLALLVVSGCGTDSNDQGPGGSGGIGVSADELLNLGESTPSPKIATHRSRARAA